MPHLRRTLKPHQLAPGTYAKKKLELGNSPRLFIFNQVGSGKGATLANCAVNAAQWTHHATVVAASMASELKQPVRTS